MRSAARRRTSRARGVWVAGVGIALTAVVAVLLLVYFISGIGFFGVAVSFLLALVPLAIVLFSIRWVDRWEPEPRWARWFAFLWGAAVSVAAALIFDAWAQSAFGRIADDDATARFLSTAIQAPIVEEGVKGLGVLLIFLVWRTNWDGPLDGVVYAATVAAGFAFSENILYFADALGRGGDALGATFVIRGLFSPFAHVVFTACVGIALGWAARRGPAVVTGAYLVGLLGAMLLHGGYNAALLLVDDYPTYYAVVQVPLFVAVIAFVLHLRTTEARTTFDRLAEYGEAGWFTPGEVRMLATTEGRRNAIDWAAALRPPRADVMRSLIADSTHLAFTRQRMLDGGDDLAARADERALLDRIEDARMRLLA
ncbi:PrsW family intramembrane metalloprotease [Agromyces sp. MMS17-SY077]|uniref:PrsW family intramembrane metalloprotease n=1 Tax=Agromyces seonyuensis TaxID=2662446 RepID=A0A6I4P417_9MICO|nr:PrsW family intramembrane metalloprotease [Agromyces seonyuensis]